MSKKVKGRALTDEEDRLVVEILMVGYVYERDMYPWGQKEKYVYYSPSGKEIPQNSPIWRHVTNLIEYKPWPGEKK